MDETTVILDKLKHLLNDVSTSLSIIIFFLNRNKDTYPEAMRESTILRIKEKMDDNNKLVERCEKLIEGYVPNGET